VVSVTGACASGTLGGSLPPVQAAADTTMVTTCQRRATIRIIPTPRIASIVRIRKAPRELCLPEKAQRQPYYQHTVYPSAGRAGKPDGDCRSYRYTSVGISDR
jgi:hypothetical protein